MARAVEYTDVTPRFARHCKDLQFNGVEIREIARRMGTAPSTIHNVLSGKIKPNVLFRRCPKCGKLLDNNNDTCVYCETLEQIDVPEFEYLDDGKNDIKLELEPPEQERYEEVLRYREIKKEDEKSSFFVGE